MEFSLLETLSGLGVGAVFGLVVFFIYRIDRRASERRLRDLIDRDIEKGYRDIEAREANTAILLELKILIISINGHSKR